MANILKEIRRTTRIEDVRLLLSVRGDEIHVDQGTYAQLLATSRAFEKIRSEDLGRSADPRSD